MRHPILALLALVATAVWAAVLAPPAESPNGAFLAARHLGKEQWCYCDGYLDGDDSWAHNFWQTLECCPEGHMDAKIKACNYLDKQQSTDFSGCCDGDMASCGDVGTSTHATKRSVADSQPNPVHIAGRKDEKKLWCYCNPDLQGKDFHKTEDCCAQGVDDMDTDNQVCTNLDKQKAYDFGGCCNGMATCGDVGTKPTKRSVAVSPPDPAHHVEVDDAEKHLWCYCNPELEGKDFWKTVICCANGNYDFDFDNDVCTNLDKQQSYDFGGCCHGGTTSCGDVGTDPSKGGSVTVSQHNAVQVAGRKTDTEKESWCYCGGDLEANDDSQTDMCCPTGHYDVDLLVCNYLKPRDIVPFEECCDEHRVICGLNGTDPNQATVQSPSTESIESLKAGTTPAPSPPNLDGRQLTPLIDTPSDTTSYSGPWPAYRGPKACFVGHCCPPVKYLADTEKCCPDGHYNSTRELCLDLNTGQWHGFMHCAREFYGYCFNQMPDSVTVGPQGPTKTEPLKLLTPAPGQLQECFARGGSKTKNETLTKQCCPRGYYNEEQEMCQNLTPSRRHQFLQCLPDHVAICHVQRPKAAAGSF